MCFVLPLANMFPVVSLWQALTSLISNTPLILTWIIISMCEIMLALKFRLCNLSPCSVPLDDQTIVHFWAPNKRQPNHPNLILIHGYGGNSRWQFYRQVGSLSRRFNLFVPDLLFFGKSYTKRSDRSDMFQAKCVGEGLKRLGVTRFSVAGISYGGYVAFRMAEIYPKEVEKVVIVSCGICCTEDQKHEELKRIGRNPLELLVPENPQDLRSLINMCVYKYDPLKWLPDFLLSNTIKVNWLLIRQTPCSVSSLATYLYILIIHVVPILSFMNKYNPCFSKLWNILINNHLTCIGDVQEQ